VAQGRLEGELANTVVGVSAVIAAMMVGVYTAGIRLDLTGAHRTN
jgi:hypothetical protein